jgi:hypothetical protein
VLIAGAADAFLVCREIWLPHAQPDADRCAARKESEYVEVPIGARACLADHCVEQRRKAATMAVLGWIALGLATAVMRGSLRRGGERRDGLAASCAIAVVVALLAGRASRLTGTGEELDP